MVQQHELSRISATRHTMPDNDDDEHPTTTSRLHKRTLLKLDTLLLPFLALLFLFNSLDKSNIGNAESAHFTTDIGLAKGDLNTAVALFFAFFVALQPAGAALGRRYGMVAWVPTCMLLWGLSTMLHVWVKKRWQLYLLRITIGCLEAGFYPVTVSYLSLFYTRFEFGRRLSMFYGQAAVGGALGGVISYFVFKHFPDRHGDDSDTESRWHPWQVLFLIEGSLTVVVALVGYFWLPHSVETAWFLTPDERRYASSRVVKDRAAQEGSTTSNKHRDSNSFSPISTIDEESRGLLNRTTAPPSERRATLDDRGLTPHDILSAISSPLVWHLLTCNILSAIPVYAFSVFLPLVLAPLTGNKASPSLLNLLTAPPHVCGAITLYLFASYSDRHRIRLRPILIGLGIMVTGLSLVVVLPTSWAVPRYLSLNVLISGAYIASPLTVAWISGNTPSPGKRALMLGINGWGNMAGVISAMLFRPQYAETGYIVPFFWTLLSVAAAAAGYVLFLRNLTAENARRQALVHAWDGEERECERADGTGPLVEERPWLAALIAALKKSELTPRLVAWLEEASHGGREGDEKMTFEFGL
ncbi:major facilitator superfamily domain-containing protein [Boeremia exigua]|uniref:major facilitator superfamily domain-containing protein n=1 Tax=Boeremia exigua TaxID=749465 RepID=UPI001E8D0948|nr:major facilitator superfamily domain-containing protein [Boeremia exigua]KAH6633474.1 major facilitator superfamily domain-containing protein [Boeremia exigua]